jgi:hypothetical protein
MKRPFRLRRFGGYRLVPRSKKNVYHGYTMQRGMISRKTRMHLDHTHKKQYRGKTNHHPSDEYRFSISRQSRNKNHR